MSCTLWQVAKSIYRICPEIFVFFQNRIRNFFVFWASSTPGAIFFPHILHTSASWGITCREKEGNQKIEVTQLVII